MKKSLFFVLIILTLLFSVNALAQPQLIQSFPDKNISGFNQFSFLTDTYFSDYDEIELHFYDSYCTTFWNLYYLVGGSNATYDCGFNVSVVQVPGELQFTFKGNNLFDGNITFTVVAVNTSTEEKINDSFIVTFSTVVIIDEDDFIECDGWCMPGKNYRKDTWDRILFPKINNESIIKYNFSSAGNSDDFSPGIVYNGSVYFMMFGGSAPGLYRFNASNISQLIDFYSATTLVADIVILDGKISIPAYASYSYVDANNFSNVQSEFLLQPVYHGAYAPVAKFNGYNYTYFGGAWNVRRMYRLNLNSFGSPGSSIVDYFEPGWDRWLLNYPVIYKDKIYFQYQYQYGSSTFSVNNATNMVHQIQSCDACPGSGAFQNSFFIYDDVVFIEIYAINASNINQVLATANVSLNHAVMKNELIYTVSGRNIYVLSVDDISNHVQSYTNSDSNLTFSNPIIFNDYLFLSAKNASGGYLFKFDIDDVTSPLSITHFYEGLISMKRPTITNDYAYISSSDSIFQIALDFDLLEEPENVTTSNFSVSAMSVELAESISQFSVNINSNIFSTTTGLVVTSFSNNDTNLYNVSVFDAPGHLNRTYTNLDVLSNLTANLFQIPYVSDANVLKVNDSSYLCEYSYSGINQSTVSFNWFLNSVSVGLNNAYYNNALNEGDTLICSVSVFDSNEFYEYTTGFHNSSTYVAGANTPPLISNVTLPSSAYSDEVISLYADCVTFNGTMMAQGYPKVSWINPDTSSSTFNMMLVEDNTYLRLHVFSETGTYTNFTYVCRDSSGNEAEYEYIGSLSISQRPPPPEGGGGGGDVIEIIQLPKSGNITGFCGDGLCQEWEDPFNCWQDCKVNLDTLFTCLWDDEIDCNWSQTWFATALLLFLVGIIGISIIYYELRKRSRR